MPWSNQNGGQGPWGGGSENGPRRTGGKNEENRQRPHRPAGGGRATPPDMDDLLRKGRQQLKQFGNGGIFLLVGLFVAAFWLLQCFYTVQQNEQAVVLRFGVPQEGIVTDGLHFRLWPVEIYYKLPLTEQIVTIGAQEPYGLMLSGDQNIVNVGFSVYYDIVDPSAYLFNVSDPRMTIQQVAESAMREVVGRRPVDDVYRDQREAVSADVLSIIQATLNKYNMGVRVKRVSLTRAVPPQDVAAAFNSVQQAEQERNRSIEQGNEERAKKLGVANGQAAHLHEAAAAYKVRIVEEARGEARQFERMAQEAANAPQATRFRLYMEAVERMLSGSGKLVLDKAGSGAVPYLPLNELLGAKPAAAKGK